SLGRAIQRGAREVPLETFEGKSILLKINLEVYSIEGFSGHSDRRQLMKFVEDLTPRPRRVIIVHGENSKCLDLASSIHKAFRVETSAPRNLDALRLR
ncbi:MAG TPA: beta-CASP ribonuclease aCPSF1, partial [Candidatus Aenigmarchaeota archaeon]|nr:beta-CASP ribonuclease aCPSF1 [Candidatus Aenigmarchaeota archaeon]